MKLMNEMFTVNGGERDRIEIGLNAGHQIYQAHFPGNPITPGVCIVQMIGELLSHRVERPLKLNRIVNLKFVAPISPVDTPAVEVGFTSVDDTGDECRAKGTISAGGAVLTKFSIIFH